MLLMLRRVRCILVALSLISAMARCSSFSEPYNRALVLPPKYVSLHRSDGDSRSKQQ